MKHTTGRLIFLTLLAAGAWAQSKREEKDVRELHAHEHTYQGLLIDAGCRDRSLWNMSKPPEPQSGAIAPTGQGSEPAQANQASGISVDAGTIAKERSDITQVMINNDLAARQSDPTCAIKGNTRAFALLLHDGRLLDLDEAGNTYATALVSASKQGHDMLNGQGPGFKPRATVVGWEQGARVFTDKMNLQ